MSEVYAKIIEDSVNENGNRLTTFEVRYQRFFHSEVMTHREFSRNASSSRAIPVKRMLELVRSSPAKPMHWGANEPGMQAHTQISEDKIIEAERLWKMAAQSACHYAEMLDMLGVHKQVTNRLTEAFQYINVLISTTNMANFLALRNHEDAMPEFRYLASLMSDAYSDNTPKLLKSGQWHLPYVDQDSTEAAKVELNSGKLGLVRLSVARCARVSYKTFEGGEPNWVKDFELYSKLVGGTPLHASPTEHQAQPDSLYLKGSMFPAIEQWKKPELHGNFEGWIQYRKTLKGEYVS